jgi:hypothetical protein
MPATCPYTEPYQSSPCPLFHVLKIHFNIILPSTPGSSRWSLSLRFPHQNPVSNFPLSYTCYMSAQLIHIDLINLIILGEERSISSSLCSYLYSLVIWSLLRPNILLCTLFSNTFDLIFPSLWATKFQTHAKLQAKNYSSVNHKLHIFG